MQKTAIVTGSSSGFGLLTSVELAKQGYNVIAAMRKTEKASLFASYIQDIQTRDRIHPIYLDVTDSLSIYKMKQRLDEYENIDVLVNNAGYALGGFAEEIEMDEYRRQFETNVFGVMAVTQAVLPKMREQGKGKIINMSSVSGIAGFPGLSAYASAKHALEGYSESLRLEVKPFGIDVALIEPGAYQTNIWSSGMEISSRSQEPSSPYREQMENLNKMIESGKGDHGNPEEVAKLVCRLAEQNEIKKLRHPIGSGTPTMAKLKKMLPWHIWEKQILKRTIRAQKREDS